MSENKYCTHCGAPVEENARFCTKCGASLDSSSAYGANGNFAGDQSYHSTYSAAHEANVEKDNQNSMAIASLVLGILALFVPYLNLLFSILAIVLGSKTKDINYGKAGMILGIITLVLSLVVDVLIIITIITAAASASGSGPWYTDISATVGLLTSLIG